MLKIAGASLLALFVGACSYATQKCDTSTEEPSCSRTDTLAGHGGEGSTGGGGGGGGGGSGGGGSGGGGSGGGGNGGSGGENNGFGNGDQDPPGNSADHNRAENDRDGRNDPSHGGNKGGQSEK